MIQKTGAEEPPIPRYRPASDLEHNSNAHNAEAAVALYELAEDGLRCCHGFALNKSELCIRLLLVVFDHGMVPLIFFFCAVRQKREHRAMSRCWRLESP
jgi:hypothetical protein